MRRVPIASWLLASVVACGACSSKGGDHAATLDASGAAPKIGSSGAGSTCNGGAPDGYCNAWGPNAEGCDCEDCTMLAKCTGKCVDDGKCHLDPKGDDCTCRDCFWKVSACAPRKRECGGGKDCNVTYTDCVCRVCSSTEYCKTHCVDDGVCERWIEGCSCADCAREPECKDPKPPPPDDPPDIGMRDVGIDTGAGADAGGDVGSDAPGDGGTPDSSTSDVNAE